MCDMFERDIAQFVIDGVEFKRIERSPVFLAKFDAGSLVVEVKEDAVLIYRTNGSERDTKEHVEPPRKNYARVELPASKRAVFSAIRNLLV